MTRRQFAMLRRYLARTRRALESVQYVNVWWDTRLDAAESETRK